MEQAIILNQSDIKKIVAEYYGIDEKQIITSKYSFVITGEINKKEE